jgi:hypothetical protein
MRKALGLAIVLLLAGCNDLVCNCPPEESGPGWCRAIPPGAGGCAASCGISVPCPGYCLPDGSVPTNPMVVRCDGGTH